MKSSRLLALALFALISFGAPAMKAQVNISVNIGPEPACPYGYYNYAPYNCAPFGYYGPTWFSSGVFFGAGPWFRGPIGFRGYIDRAYDPRFGYHGAFPVRGEHADWGRHRGWEQRFHASEYREEVRHDNGHHYGQYKDHDDHGRGHDREDHGNGHGKGNGHGHDDHGQGHGHDRD